jgi:hypothetical protein
MDLDHSLGLFFEHDLIRKPVSILGSSPRTGIFGIMLKLELANIARVKSTAAGTTAVSLPPKCRLKWGDHVCFAEA